jgi:hypothetical protein
MALQGFRVTFIYNEGVAGFTETLYLPNAVDANDAKTKAQNLLKKRMLTMGAGVNFVGCRISQATAKRRTTVFTAADVPGLSVPAGTVADSKGNTVDNAADVVKTCLQLRMEGVNSNAKSMYFAGIPDAAIITDPELGGFALITAFSKAFDNWKAQLLKDGWGYKSLVPEAGNFVRYNITGVLVDNATGLLSAVVNGGIPAGYAIGSTVAIHGNTRLATSFKSWNGQHTIRSLTDLGNGTTGIMLNGTAGIDSTKFVKLGTVQLIDYGVTTISNILVIRQTAHKRGNRFLLPVARRRVVQRV